LAYVQAWLIIGPVAPARWALGFKFAAAGGRRLVARL